ncbi:MAG: hypothetical protein QOE55_8252, partial [Acidobacteriaceae bacterium]|nr:hypothetical protein [Acidobacteriaceae bacterium]
MLDRPRRLQHPAVFVQVVVAELGQPPAQESFRLPSHVKRPAAGMTGSMNEGQHHRLARGNFRPNPNGTPGAFKVAGTSCGNNSGKHCGIERAAPLDGATGVHGCVVRDRDRSGICANFLPPIRCPPAEHRLACDGGEIRPLHPRHSAVDLFHKGNESF